MGPKEPAPAGVQMKISGYDVHFPFKPYASQLVLARHAARPRAPRRRSSSARRDTSARPRASPSRSRTILAPSVSPRPTPSTAQGVMGKVLKAADSGENALLESPTGSGKSLALLCSGTPLSPRFLAPRLSRTPERPHPPSAAVALTPTPTFSVRARFASALAWQERWKATHGVGGAGVKVDAEGWIEDADPSSAPASSGEKENVVSPDARRGGDAHTPEGPSHILRHAHAQSDRAGGEGAQTHGVSTSMVVLGSREHYCINKSVRARRGGNLGEECKALLEGGARRSGIQTREDADERGGGGGGGCGYSHGAMKLAGAARRPGSDPVDIEDLVARSAGRRAGVRISPRNT